MATDTNPPSVWPTIPYADEQAAIRFLEKAFGFEEAIVVPGEKEGTIAHAELRWPPGGGIMLGASDPSHDLYQPPGTSGVYAVTDDPDALYERAVAAGAEVVRPLKDEDYGSRGFTVKDPESNYWSFGTYRGS